MANYSYQSSSFSSGGNAENAFQQADADRDGRLDIGEFRNFLGQNAGSGASWNSGSSYDASSFGASSGAGYGAAAGFGVGAGAGAGFGASSFESSSSSAAAGGAGAGYDASFAVGGGLAAGAGFGGASAYESYSSGAGFAGDAAVVSGAQTIGTSAATTNVVTQYATDAQGLYKDPNPQIIRRPAIGGVQTYTQNIKVRFLQPPPIPPPGPLIIKEVRPPQPPPPPPLRIRQQAPPLPTPPPLILREKPPQPPAAVASQTVIRRLGALPVPPRSVIIERLPALPPRPRDIIIERWVPYGAQAKRRTIVQRAAAAKDYAKPRNVIIQYEPVQVRVVRQFQRLGVVQANPQAYIQQYGAHLLEASILLQQARAAGVVEDISAPAGSAVAVSGGSFGGAVGWESGASLVSGGAVGVDGGLAAGGAVGGFDAGAVGGGVGGGFSSSSFESSSFASGGGASGVEAGFVAGGGYGGSSFESSGFSSGFGAGGAGGAESVFQQADANKDGALDINEFRNFYAQNIGGGGGGASSSFESFSS